MARIYSMAELSLYNRKNGIVMKLISNAWKKKLTDLEEETLIKRILSLNRYGFLPYSATIVDWANLLL